jgi:hypothetical protein
LNSRTAAGDVGRDGAGLRRGHLALRAEHFAELADVLHHVGRGDRHVEVEEALLDLLGQVLAADDVSAGRLGLLGLLALGEHAILIFLPVPRGIVTEPRTSWSVFFGSMPMRTASSTDSSNFDGWQLLQQLDRLVERVALAPVDRAAAFV